MTLVASDMRRPGEPLVAGARPVRSTSPHAKKAASTDSHTVRRWLLASRLYSITLGYASPKSFFAVAPDGWPGNAAIGQRLIRSTATSPAKGAHCASRALQKNSRS